MSNKNLSDEGYSTAVAIVNRNDYSTCTQHLLQQRCKAVRVIRVLNLCR